MSGLYVIGVVVLWLWLTALLRKSWWRWRKPAFAWGYGRWYDGIALVVALLWFGGSFWYGGGRKYYYDWRVEQMCAVDGGVKVYETVRLPAERFDNYGNIGIQNRQYARPTDQYYFETEEKYLRAGNPTLIRSVTRIIRRSDRKVLGESTRYGRGGGDLPGPWHPSTFDCPPIRDLKLESSIFTTGVGE